MKLFVILLAACLAYVESSTRSVSLEEVETIVSDLWNSDVNAVLESQMTINFGSYVRSGSKQDKSSHKLFTRVDPNAISGPTYRTLKSLFDNYNPLVGVSESVTSAERRENDAFLTAVSDTAVMEKARVFLKGKGFSVANSKNSFKAELKRLWFTNLRRKSNDDTSAFEHVFIGEFTKKSGRKDQIKGMHSWYRFYELEKNGDADYAGYVMKRGKLFVVNVYEYEGYWKAMGGFWIGTSPEFELAVYTICFLTHPGRSACKFSVGNQRFDVTTYSMVRRGQTYIGSAYPSPSRR